MLALFFFWRAAQVTDWRAIAPIGRRSGYVMRPRRLLWMGLLAVAPTLLFFFQALFVDYRLMAALQDDETQYLLLTRHLGYTLLAQHFPLPLFQFTVNGVTDRLVDDVPPRRRSDHTKHGHDGTEDSHRSCVESHGGLHLPV